MSNNNIYKNVCVEDTLLLQSGHMESQIYDCTTSNGHGSNSLRRISIPNPWTITDIGFKFYKSLTDPDPKVLFLSDGVDKTLYTIPTTNVNYTFALLPWVFDTVKFFSILVSVPQPQDSLIELVLAPIYQGEA